ncbi:MAG: nucleotide exchange factor GrpE [Burkholderiaceae bacterium]|nr:nucleotide exchange factor GrpE [Burkholderiaceae bacterium]
MKREEEKVNEEVVEETAQAEATQEQEVAAEPSVEEQLAAAQAQVATLQDSYLRAMAEMEKSRRRADEAVERAHKFAVEKFAKNMLPVIDSLEKALEIAGDEKNPMIEGVEATYRQLVKAMEMSGMVEINPVGEKFDPTKHQAITMVPAMEGQESGHVAQVFQRGWLINERVLRAALVSVVQ